MFDTVTIGQSKHQKPTEPYAPLHITVSYVPDQRTIRLDCFEHLAEKNRKMSNYLRFEIAVFQI